MLPHPQRQRDRASVDQPGVERADHAADVDHGVVLDPPDELGRADHGAAHRVAVPVDVLRQRVHDEVDAEFERAQRAAAWRTWCPRTRARPPRARSAATASKSVMRVVGFAGVSVCSSFVFGRSAALTASRSLVSTNVTSMPYRSGSNSVNKPEDRLVAHVRDDDVVAGAQEREEHGVQRGDAAGQRHGRFPVLEHGELLLQRELVHPAVARVQRDFRAGPADLARIIGQRIRVREHERGAHGPGAGVDRVAGVHRLGQQAEVVRVVFVWARAHASKTRAGRAAPRSGYGQCYGAASYFSSVVGRLGCGGIRLGRLVLGGGRGVHRHVDVLGAAGAGALGRRGERGQVDGVALGVDHGRLAEHRRERLAARDLADHAGDLAVLVEHLDELARLHVVLGRALHEVLGELVLADLDLFLLDDRVEQDLAAERLLAGDSVTSARCTSSSRRFSFSRWRCTSSSTSCGGTGISTDSSSLSTSWSRAWAPCPNTLDRAICSRMSRLQLVDGVELAGDLGEVVVGVGKLALLDGEHLDGDLGRLALVVAAEQLRFERRRLAGAERVERLVDALDELAGADLVGDRRWRVSTSPSSMVATRSSWTKSPVFAGRSTVIRVPKRLQQALQLVVDVVIRHLDGVDGRAAVRRGLGG